jgi:predicted GIY-YIG superfamily endonuclease
MEQHKLKLLYHKTFNNIFNAVKREREINGWSRKKKEKLIRGRK